ncbi:unnamed protein product [Rotaria sp. Silwood2]|nr:unnamed protein product [Rotaria sp. Silwood2]
MESDKHIYLYSIKFDKLLPILTGTETLTAITESEGDSSLYFAMLTSQISKKENFSNEIDWKYVIQYREHQSKERSSIYRIDINRKHRMLVKKVSFQISELLFSPAEQMLILASTLQLYEYIENFEIYSIHLHNVTLLSKLTNNEQIEYDLQLSCDGKQVLYQTRSFSSSNGKFRVTQSRLYSVDLTHGQIERLAKDFEGSITGYVTRSDGGIYILGQLGTNVQIYTQRSSSKYSILNRGWKGTYELISLSSMNSHDWLAFVHSSFRQPKEVYFVDNINELRMAKMITNENQLFTRRNLPETKVYQWINNEDHRMIERILYYPPGKFELQNLPVLVFIHGGPYSASINRFQASTNYWASLAASEGWLVLEPNYRGSTGYGDKFLSEDGIANPDNLAIGGYSCGGFLTNWLITQTTRFNAALSGAGSTDHISAWKTMDLSVHLNYLFGGFPWEVPYTYQNESPIYHLDKVRTPTHIITGENDRRVPADQSCMLERGLYYRGIPIKLLVFPNEGHSLNKNP